MVLSDHFHNVLIISPRSSRQAQQELSHRLDELAGESASSGDASAPSAKPEALLIELQADKARLDGELKIAQAEHYRLLSEARQAQLKVLLHSFQDCPV